MRAYVVGTLDTKGVELRYLRDRVVAAGVEATLVDVSTSGDESHGDVSPTEVAEHHPAGTRYDAPDAPIATGHFPYNRCEVWRCADGSRVFLRYTEVGGYYVDMRIREVDEALIVDTATPPSTSPGP